MYLVISGIVEKMMSSDSHHEAAIDFLNTEDGPFGTLISVSNKTASNKDEDMFFHTKTLLSDIDLEFVETPDHKIFSLVHFQEENV